MEIGRNSKKLQRTAENGKNGEETEGNGRKQLEIGRNSKKLQRAA